LKVLFTLRCRRPGLTNWLQTDQLSSGRAKLQLRFLLTAVGELTVSLETAKRVAVVRKRPQLGVTVSLFPRGMVPRQLKVTVCPAAFTPGVPASQSNCSAGRSRTNLSCSTHVRPLWALLQQRSLALRQKLSIWAKPVSPYRALQLSVVVETLRNKRCSACMHACKQQQPVQDTYPDM
jgi:hypothetical protein